MKFEWNAKKNHSNQEKHGIDFASAALVFLDADRIEIIDNRKDYGEIRYLTTGKTNNILFVVVYTKRGENYRIISARKANKNERETYLHHQQVTQE